jgi:DNA-binding CsgD family transcriptional regulator
MTLALRPIERRVARMVDGGIDTHEIARRFQRSPEFIDRVIEMTKMPGRGGDAALSAISDQPLRPVERCILGWLDRGAGPAEIGLRLQRSTGFVERVEDLARFKLAAH